MRKLSSDRQALIARCLIHGSGIKGVARLLHVRADSTLAAGRRV